MAARQHHLTSAVNSAWFEHLAVAAFIIDQDHLVVAWNRACEELTGLLAKDILGTRDHWRGFYDKSRICLADMVLDDSLEKNRKFYENVSKFSDQHEALGLQAENWCQTPSGLKYLLFEANEIIDDKGQIIGAIETLRDITNRKAKEARHNLIIDENPAAIYLLEVPDNLKSQPNIYNISSALLAMTGYTRHDWYDDPLFWINNIHPDDRNNAVNTLQRMEIGKKNSVEYRFRKKNGDYFWVLDQYVTFLIDGLPNKHILGSWMDIDERKRSEYELKKLSQAIKQSPSAVIITNKNGIIEYVNPVFVEMTGYESEEILGKNTEILNVTDNNSKIFKDMHKTVASEGLWRGEIKSVKKDGTIYWSRLSISAIKDETNKVSHYISIQEDISSEYQLKQKLTYQATHDALTGLVNRDAFEDKIKHVLSDARATYSTHAMSYLDLDKFKLVNDTCGHAAGDELLRQLSIILKDRLRSSDVLARIGGDEFAVLMEHCSMENAEKVAISLRDAVREFRFCWDNKTFNIGVSIGLVPLNFETTDYAEAMKQADTACYAAKNLGGNRIHIYHHDDKELAKMHGEMVWVERIYKALDEDRICLYAQRIVPRNKKYDVCFIEILLRIIDEDGSIVSPGEFLPAAERYNIATKIDTRVFSLVSKIIGKNSEKLPEGVRFFVNLSGHTISDVEYHDFILDQFSENKIDPNRICFEITESAAITNMSMATLFISKMKSFGCHFALDDFGSGLSSFGYLKSLPVDYIKIDGMFVKDIIDDEIDRAMVRSINEIGHVMGKQTIAEYVENAAIKNLLETIGVDYLQGYGISKPVAVEEIIKTIV